MKHETTYPMAGTKVAFKRNSQQGGMPGRRQLFRDENHNMGFILSIFIFLLMMSFMAYLIHHLLVFIESVIFERSHTLLKVGSSVSQLLYYLKI